MKKIFSNTIRWIYVGTIIYLWLYLVLTVEGTPLERLFDIILVTALASVFLGDFWDDIIKLFKKAIKKT